MSCLVKHQICRRYNLNIIVKTLSLIWFRDFWVRIRLNFFLLGAVAVYNLLFRLIFPTVMNREREREKEINNNKYCLGLYILLLKIFKCQGPHHTWICLELLKYFKFLWSLDFVPIIMLYGFEYYVLNGIELNLLNMLWICKISDRVLFKGANLEW